MSENINNIRQIIKFPESCREVTLPRFPKGYEPLAAADVELAGVSELVPGYEILRDRPTSHLVIFTLAGEGVFHSGNKKFLLGKDSLLFSPAGRFQHYYPNNAPWHKMWFHLKDAAYWQHLKSMEPFLREGMRCDALLSASRQFIAESLADIPESARAANLYAELICVHLRRDLNYSMSSADISLGRKLGALWDVVYSDVRRKWTLRELSKIAHISPPHLSRTCRERHKTSPMRMVTKLRMLRAEELLQNTDWTLADIAEAVGYDNPFAFSNAFKRTHGSSPKLYKASRLRQDSPC